MKRAFIVLMTFIVMIFNGCNDLAEDSESKFDRVKAPQVMFDKIISALDDRDSEALKSLFAPNALIKTSDIDSQITEIMELYKGKFISNSSFSEGTGSSSRSNGKLVYLTISPNIRELKTDEDDYSIIFNAVSVDDENPNDVGLWRIMLWFDTEEKREKEKNFEYVIPDCIVGYDYEGRANELDE